MTDLYIAQEIQNQIGHKAFFMMGAKQLAGGNNYLQFKIGRNAGGFNMVKVILDSDDTYTIEFLMMATVKYVPTVKKYAAFSGIYNDMLHSIIQSTTGLALSLSAHYADFKSYPPHTTQVPAKYQW